MRIDTIFNLFADQIIAAFRFLQNTVVQFGGFRLSFLDLFISLIVLRLLFMVVFPWFDDGEDDSDD